MATKRFCDVCDILLTEEDTKPLIRQKSYQILGSATHERLKASVMITNDHDHPVQDVCIKCRLHVINEGQKVEVATLQVSPSLFGTHNAPPPPPTLVEKPLFEPSLKPDPANPAGASELHDEST